MQLRSRSLIRQPNHTTKANTQKETFFQIHLNKIFTISTITKTYKTFSTTSIAKHCLQNTICPNPLLSFILGISYTLGSYYSFSYLFLYQILKNSFYQFPFHSLQCFCIDSFVMPFIVPNTFCIYHFLDQWKNPLYQCLCMSSTTKDSNHYIAFPFYVTPTKKLNHF